MQGDKPKTKTVQPYGADPEGRDRKRTPGQRHGRMQSVSKAFSPMFKRNAGKIGPLVLSLVRHWPDIVGREIAAVTSPRSVHYSGSRSRRLGVLTVQVAPEAALFIQHETTAVLERCNRFLGYQALTSVKLKQADLNTNAGDNFPSEPNSLAHPVRELALSANEVRDPELSEALARLKAQVVARAASK